MGIDFALVFGTAKPTYHKYKCFGNCKRGSTPAKAAVCMKNADGGLFTCQKFLQDIFEFFLCIKKNVF